MTEKQIFNLYKWRIHLEDGSQMDQTPDKNITDFNVIRIELIPQGHSGSSLFYDIPANATPVYFRHVEKDLFSGCLKKLVFNIGYDIENSRYLKYIEIQ